MGPDTSFCCVLLLVAAVAICSGSSDGELEHGVVVVSGGLGEGGGGGRGVIAILVGSEGGGLTDQSVLNRSFLLTMAPVSVYESLLASCVVHDRVSMDGSC